MNLRKPQWRDVRSLCALAGLLTAVGVAGAAIANMLIYPDSSGGIATFTSAGNIDTTNAFFQPLDKTGRTCVMCHQPGSGWGLSLQNIRQRYRGGMNLDPLFHTLDGATCPTDYISTAGGRASAYSLLLTKGLIRIPLSVPEKAEFEIIGMQDPYACSTATTLSVYRRPPSVANVRFDTSVVPPASVVDKFGPVLAAFMRTLTTAQLTSNQAGRLDAAGGQGGPAFLSRQPFSYGVNDPMGTTMFNRNVVTLYESWAAAAGMMDTSTAARESIARGEAIFNTRPITIQGVAGLNDVAGNPVITGYCVTCHNTPNVGNHSVFAPMNTGVEDGSRRTPDLPLFVLRNNATGEIVETSDPGMATATGKWADVSKFSVPPLRGLAARAPYFRNGSASSVSDVIDFYDERFGMGLGSQEKLDLAAFLNAL